MGLRRVGLSMHKWIALGLSLVPLGVLSASFLSGGSKALAFADLPLLDAGPSDVGPSDAGPSDVGPSDAGPSDAGPLKIIARTHWDARMAGGKDVVLRGVTRYPHGADVFDGIVVHHSDFSEPGGPSAVLDYHLDVNGWSDIGYHYVIGQDGTVYEGRALHYMGAHAGQSKEANRGVAQARRKKGASGTAALLEARRLDPDYGAIGIVLDGFYHFDAPPLAQQHALKQLIVSLQQRYSISSANLIGHREVHEKRVTSRGLTFTGPLSVCPGDAAFAWFVQMRAQLKREESIAALTKVPAQ